MNKYSPLLFVMAFSFLFGDANVQIRLQNGQIVQGEFVGTYMNHVHILVEEKIIYYACDDITSITYSAILRFDYDCSINTVTADILFPPQLDPMTGEMTQMLPDVFNPDIPKPAVEKATSVIQNPAAEDFVIINGIKFPKPRECSICGKPIPLMTKKISHKSCELKLEMDLRSDFDKITFKDGNTYLGEFATIDGDIVFFKPKGASDFHSISIKRIQTLKIKDGLILYAAEGTYEQLGYEQADEHIQYGEWDDVKGDYLAVGFFAWAPYLGIPYFFGAQKEVKMKMDNLLKDNKGGLNDNNRNKTKIRTLGGLFNSISYGISIRNRALLNVQNVNVDMMTDDEKTLYISGYEKRIKEMRTASISTGCLVDVGVFFVLWMNLD